MIHYEHMLDILHAANAGMTIEYGNEVAGWSIWTQPGFDFTRFSYRVKPGQIDCAIPRETPKEHDAPAPFNESGSKYLRPLLGAFYEEGCMVDVYAILKTFDVRCPARQHAIKKLLCAGLRGKATEEQDLKEARDAVDRAMQLAIQVVEDVA